MDEGWGIRSIDPALAARWKAEGLWTDETLGEVLAVGLTGHASQTFQVHSDVRPWIGTFADLDLHARRLAAGLRAAGIGPGDPVAFQLPNWVEAAITFYAVSYLGAVIVPIVHFYGPKEVAYILRHTGVRAFVTAARFGAVDYLAAWPAIAGQFTSPPLVAVVGADRPPPAGAVAFEELMGGSPIDHPASVDPDSPALVAYTSGTTAEPKGVIHSHRTIGCETRQLGALQPAGAPPNLVGLPVGHAMGMLSALLIPVQRGNPVHLVDVWNPPALLATMREYGLGCGSGAPFFLTSLMDHPDFTDEHLALMHWVGMGGAAVPAAVAQRATDAGISIVRMYGSTEHPSITGGTHDEPEAKRLNTDGRPLTGVEIRLVDDDGNDVGPDTPGEILSRGPDCCIGYIDASATALAFDVDGWFHTGDIGVRDPKGYLTIVDRKKDVIIRGGENVSAVEVEELLLGIDGITEAAVVAGPDARLGERVVAFVCGAGGVSVPSLQYVRSALGAAGLTRQKWPEDVRAVDALPRTPTGKVRKEELRARLRAEASQS